MLTIQLKIPIPKDVCIVLTMNSDVCSQAVGKRGAHKSNDTSMFSLFLVNYR